MLNTNIYNLYSVGKCINVLWALFITYAQLHQNIAWSMMLQEVGLGLHRPKGSYSYKTDINFIWKKSVTE